MNLQPDNFYILPPRRPNPTFMKLFYRIPRTPHNIRVDLLLSTVPELEIPRFLIWKHFVYLNQLPVAPLHFVLYHKLLGWQERTNAQEPWKRKKARETDKDDIIGLCVIAYRNRLRPLSKSHMGGQFLDNFRRRADDFVQNHGRIARTWFRRLHFHV